MAVGSSRGKVKKFNYYKTYLLEKLLLEYYTNEYTNAITLNIM